jgi:hypothetical protein
VLVFTPEIDRTAADRDPLGPAEIDVFDRPRIR